MTTRAPDGVDREIAAGYDATGAAWQRGPGRVYDGLASAMVERAGVDWTGRRVLDVGAGTGAASRALVRVGARPVALDAAFGMLAAAVSGAPAAVADARRLPVATASVDGYVAAFCLNHLDDPAVALREARRVVVGGGPVVVSAYAADDTHPVKEAVDEAARAVGWRPPDWSTALKAQRAMQLATVEAAEAAGAAAGLTGIRAERRSLPFPDLGPEDLVAWRLGMAQVAPFVATRSPEQREALARDALRRLGPCGPLERRIVVLHATA